MSDHPSGRFNGGATVTYPQNEFRILKVCLKGEDSIQVKYEKATDQGKWEQCELLSPDIARKEFYKALGGLVPCFLKECELNNVLPEEDITVIGMSLSWKKDIMGAVITALRKLENSSSPQSLNTPHKPSMPYSDGGDTRECLGDKTVMAIELVIEETKRYISGDRPDSEQEQLELELAS